jgi:hypothetical protein
MLERRPKRVCVEKIDNSKAKGLHLN